MMNNPTIDSRTVDEALAHAEQKREELPQIVQVYPSDWDLCVLADEVYRLRKRLKELTKPKDAYRVGSPYDLSQSGGLPALHKQRRFIK